MKMRRSGRLFKSVPILLIGSDAEGRTFSEDTHLDRYDHGDNDGGGRAAAARAGEGQLLCLCTETFGKDVVTIAVPFSLESANAAAICVRARVVNVSEIPEQKIFRCVMAFLPVAGTRTHT